ncbi:hypothetical protein [Halochromatium roseum]|uniref:hypothetical protein n=1 Tax=Halochromatium roseum TaxID=391920 RepID=UPI001F5C259D|nr:hypothetical protein [Halochromatium roseum]
MRNSIASDKHWNMKPNLGRAMMLAQRQLPEFVCDAVNLEGIPFTLPEIQTLLDGITVGGHKLSDQQVAINQAEAWRHLFKAIKQAGFSLSGNSPNHSMPSPARKKPWLGGRSEPAWSASPALTTGRPMPVSCPCATPTC